MSTKLTFAPTDILLPKGDYSHWACIACDQFTSQRDYWERAYEQTLGVPSALNLILPEVYLEDDDAQQRVEAINAKMREYLDGDVFDEYKNAMICVERTQPDGRVRRGIVGAFALADYSYTTGEKALIRPTEGTVLSRIPPRVAIRRNAPLELPHIMIFMDDKKREIIEGIDTSRLKLLYDFDLMLGGGHIRGWLIDEKEQQRILSLLAALEEESGQVDDKLLYAVGDGNHSLATAKAAAAEIGTEAAQYALAELVNIHSEAISFEPIYRVLFNADVQDVIGAVRGRFARPAGNKVQYIAGDESGTFYVSGFEAGEVQRFIDDYMAQHPDVRVDYIHGEDTLRTLASQPDSVGFIYDGIGKDQLFSYVRENGILPRKSFSVGHAEDKRYYIEARRIQ